MTVPNKYFVMRVDGSHAVGYGHVMRLIGLASAVKSRGAVPVFALKYFDEQVLKILSAADMCFETLPAETSARQDAEYLRDKFSSREVVLDIGSPLMLSEPDQYSAVIRAFKEAGFFVLMFDGLNEECFASQYSVDVDWLCLPYFGAKDQSLLPTQAKVLLGMDYYVLRPEFLKAKFYCEVGAKVENILVTMGGGDPCHATLRILEILRGLEQPGPRLKVVLGKSFDPQDHAAIQEMLRDWPLAECLDGTSDMPELMQWADFAIISSGLTRYEAAFMGLPSAVVAMNSAHDGIMKKFVALGTCVYLGQAQALEPALVCEQIQSLISDQEARLMMSRKGRMAVDGKGAERILNSLLQKRAG